MKTVTIIIGNSDDKLTQREWSEFVYFRCNTWERHIARLAEDDRRYAAHKAAQK